MSDAKRRNRRNMTTGSPGMVLKTVWYAIRKAADLMDDPEATPEQILRAVHAVAGASNAWSRAHEQHQLRTEVQDLRELVETIQADREMERGHR